MDRKTNVNVGTLVKELRRFESKYPDYDIACYVPDDTRCRMVGLYTDDDGSLNLLMEEEMDGGDYYDVDSILSCLDSYDRTMGVHVAACGLLMDIEVFRDGTFFDVDEDCDAVFCDGEVYGEYEEETGSGWLTEAEKRMLAEEARKQKREDCIEYAVLSIMIVLVAGDFLYNVWAAVTRSGATLWENILWSVTCLFLLVIGVPFLHYNKPPWKKEE